MLAASCLGAAGCETEIVRGPVEVHHRSADVPRTSSEERLRDAVKKDPGNAKAWIELGTYYEDGLQLVDAAQCYERAHSLVDGRRFTGCHFLLARVYARLEDFDRAVRHLESVFALEPRERRVACANEHFREAHFLRGAIHFTLAEWRRAEREFEQFVALGGDGFRCEEWRSRIRQELR